MTPWNANTALAHMSRVQTALDTNGLNGTEPAIGPHMFDIVKAFKARDLLGVEAGCEGALRAIREMPAKKPKPREGQRATVKGK